MRVLILKEQHSEYTSRESHSPAQGGYTFMLRSSWRAHNLALRYIEMSLSQMLVSYNICITASIWGKWGRRPGVLFIMLTVLPRIFSLPSLPLFAIMEDLQIQKINPLNAPGGKWGGRMLMDKLSVRNHKCILLWSYVFTNSEQFGCFCNIQYVAVQKKEWKRQQHDHIYL